MHVRAQTTSTFAKVMTGIFFAIMVIGSATIIVAQFLQNRQLQTDKASANADLEASRAALKDQTSQANNLRQQLMAAYGETPLQSQQRIFAEVSQLYKNIPKETPSFAEVKDKSKLNTQPFFADIENADYIIIFDKSQFAIVYRPSEHKIINAGNIKLQ